MAEYSITLNEFFKVQPPSLDGGTIKVVDLLAPTNSSSEAEINDRAEKGIKGEGFTGGSYNSTTGVITFSSSQFSGFSTEDIRGRFVTVQLEDDVTTGQFITAGGKILTEDTIEDYLGVATENGTGSNLLVNPVISGDYIFTQTDGEYTDGSWTDGVTLYFTDAGALTETHPTGKYRKAGVSLTTSSYIIDPGPVVTETDGYPNTVIVTDDGGYLPDELINLSTLPVSTAGSGSEDSLVKTDSNGFIPLEFWNIDNNSVNTGGSGSEDTLIRTDSSGYIDSSFLFYTADTTPSGSSVDIDFSEDVVQVDIGVSSSTFTFSNANTVDEVIVIIQNSSGGSISITYPSELQGTSLLTEPADGEYNVYTFFTTTGGTDYYISAMQEGLT